MFRHHEKSRTLIHNLMLASLLSFVAVIVNGFSCRTGVRQREAEIGEF